MSLKPLPDQYAIQLKINTLAGLMHRNNAFDLLRLLLALAVLLSHSYLLFDGGPAEPLVVFSKQQTSIGDLAVLCFFALSGYLITASFDHSRGYKQFLFNRFIRILPGFWVALMVTAFVLSPAIYLAEHHTLLNFRYGGQNSALSYVFNNAGLRINQPSMQNLEIKGYNVTGAVNGSLWTLYPEFQCYLFTLVAGGCGLFSRNKWLLVLLFCTLFLVYAVDTVTHSSYGPTLFTLAPYFKFYLTYLGGSLVWVFSDKLAADKKGQLFLLGVFLIFLKFGGFMLVAPLLVPLLIINTFSGFKMPHMRDISYGIYIYAFPVQLLVHHSCQGNVSFPLQVVFAFAGTTVLALLSAILIEQPALKLKRRFQF